MVISFSTILLKEKLHPHKTSSTIYNYVMNNSGEINLFVDRAIYDIKKIKNKKKNYAWLLESKSIAPDLIDYFKNNIENLNDFELVFTHNLELLNFDDKFKFCTL